MELNQWFALRVKGRRERVVSSLLVEKGYPSFLPTYPSYDCRRPARTRQSEIPFFPGYLFCRFDVCRRLPILKTPGVLHIVSIGKAPAPVDDNEIVSLQKAVEHRLTAQPSEYLRVGTKVRITDGALAGVEGVVLEFKNSLHLILSVSLLCRSVRVEVPKELVMAGSPGAMRYLREPKPAVDARS